MRLWNPVMLLLAIALVASTGLAAKLSPYSVEWESYGCSVISSSYSTYVRADQRDTLVFDMAMSTCENINQQNNTCQSVNVYEELSNSSWVISFYSDPPAQLPPSLCTNYGDQSTRIGRGWLLSPKFGNNSDIVPGYNASGKYSHAYPNASQATTLSLTNFLPAECAKKCNDDVNCSAISVVSTMTQDNATNSLVSSAWCLLFYELPRSSSHILANSLVRKAITYVRN